MLKELEQAREAKEIKDRLWIEYQALIPTAVSPKMDPEAAVTAMQTPQSLTFGRKQGRDMTKRKCDGALRNVRHGCRWTDSRRGFTACACTFT